ncbi:hypothetical protein KP509_26G059200 [Ceratopteris richardii]|nr:hypothetical protein KP509_26G059200 [Ceratopteris richardii]
MSLKHEFRCRQGWYNLVIAMATGPDFFVEGRRILNAWLVSSGALCIWELKRELGVIVREVVEYPSSWKLSMDAGLSLPPFSAFYSGSLASMLSRPPNWNVLQELCIKHFLQNEGQSCIGNGGVLAGNVPSKSEPSHGDMVGLDSSWMLFMEFPAWILFAFISLFQRPNDCCDKSLNAASGHDNCQDSDGLMHEAWLSHQEVAAQFIAWHFSPHDRQLRCLVVQMLRQMVQEWLQIEYKETHCGPKVKDKDIQFPACKRRRLTNASTKCQDGEEVVELSTDESMHRANQGNTCSQGGVMVAVEKWLLSFEDCCHLLDSSSQERTLRKAATTIDQQARVGSAVSDDANATARKQGFQHPESSPIHIRSMFFNDFPLAALSFSPFLHEHSVVHLVLHSVMLGSGFWLSKDTYFEVRKDLACKEPSHRTEDFRDKCKVPFCLNFASHACASTASLISRIFKFLETLELLEFSTYVDGHHGPNWLDGFKDAVVRQLVMCVRSWSEQVNSAYSLTVLDDLQHRASLWASRTRLESSSMNVFKKVLQGLDILIASSVVDDSFVNF